MSNFTQDLKERFLKFGTFSGPIKIGIALGVIYTAVFHLAFAIQAYIIGRGVILTIEGLRETFVNPIKQEVAKQVMVAKAVVTTPPSVSTPATVAANVSVP